MEQYVYCPQNWWLARHGADPSTEGSRRGNRVHAEAGRVQDELMHARKEHRSGLRWSFRILAVAASVTGLTLGLLFLDTIPLPWLFVTLGLVLTAASTGLLVIALDAESRERRLAEESGIPTGTVLDSDLKGRGRLLHDPEWDLHGTPDTVIQGANGPVPMEIKSSRTPPEPHDNHRLQLACYLRLLAANGTPATHGLLTYPDGVFPIQWTPELETELKGVVDRIHASRASGEADRDHRIAGRCRGCARRDACQQAL